MFGHVTPYKDSSCALGANPLSFLFLFSVRSTHSRKVFSSFAGASPCRSSPPSLSSPSVRGTDTNVSAVLSLCFSTTVLFLRDACGMTSSVLTEKHRDRARLMESKSQNLFSGRFALGTRKRRWISAGSLRLRVCAGAVPCMPGVERPPIDMALKASRLPYSEGKTSVAPKGDPLAGVLVVASWGGWVLIASSRNWGGQVRRGGGGEVGPPR